VLDEAATARAVSAPFVHLGGTGLLAAMDGAPTAALLAAARATGRTTTFDLIAAGPHTLDVVRPALPYVDWFVPSIEEARAMCGLGPVRDVARFFRDLGARNVALTMGGDGCLVVTPDATLRLPAYDLVVSDTTGCGDAFTAGLIAGLHRGWDVERAARFAGAAGALVATGLGSDAGIVDFDGTVRAMETLPTRGPVEA
jgi:sugar/nucleoside kinase (ribokinase family)